MSDRLAVRVITPCSRPERLPAIAESLLYGLPEEIDLDWLLLADEHKRTRFPKLPTPNGETDELQLDGVGAGRIYEMARPGSSPSRIRVVVTRGGGTGGNLQRNAGLNLVESGLVRFLDDDTVEVSGFYPRLLALAREFPGRAFVFDQVVADGRYRLSAHPESMRPCYVDTGQVVAPMEMIGELRWMPDSATGDGIFFQALHDLHRDRFVFVNEPLSIYNALR